jgi:hypothetical protein
MKLQFKRQQMSTLWFARSIDSACSRIKTHGLPIYLPSIAKSGGYEKVTQDVGVAGSALGGRMVDAIRAGRASGSLSRQCG